MDAAILHCSLVPFKGSTTALGHALLACVPALARKNRSEAYRIAARSAQLLSSDLRARSRARRWMQQLNNRKPSVEDDDKLRAIRVRDLM